VNLARLTWEEERDRRIKQTADFLELHNCSCGNCIRVMNRPGPELPDIQSFHTPDCPAVRANEAKWN
jgi:hypothetical protein